MGGMCETTYACMQTAMGRDDRMCINGKKKGRSNDEQQSWCDAVRCGASKGAEVLAELKIIDIESCTKLEEILYWSKNIRRSRA